MKFRLTLLLLFSLLAKGDDSFVSVKKDNNGVWWFAQNGRTFLSLGVNHVNNGGSDDGVGGREKAECLPLHPLCGDTLSFAPKYGFAPYYNSTMARWGSQEAWVQETIKRLISWGFNSVGGWSATIIENQPSIYYAHLLDMGTTWQQHSYLPDLWAQSTLTQVDTIAKKECLPRANHTNLLGYQTDNELDWDQPFLRIYLQYTPTAPGFQRAIQFLQEKYKVISALNTAWRINATSFTDVPKFLNDPSLNQNVFGNDQYEFLGIVATQYFKITTEAIKRYDTNHLILGARFASLPDPVLRALIPYVDVIDKHGYDNNPPWNLDYFYQVTGKPVMVGEFSFTALDSNMPNTIGARANNPFANQNQRAEAYKNYATKLISLPYAIGYHWWQYADEPSSGRWPDGEDSNYGIVAINDDPYEVLTQQMTMTNSMLENLHKGSGKQ